MNATPLLLLLLLPASLPAIPEGPLPPGGAASAASPGYHPEAQRDGIGELPESAWGPEVQGLQAALVSPPEIRLNEVATLHVVVRNVTRRTIRVTFPAYLKHLHLQPLGSPLMYGINRQDGRPVTWELKPGQRVNVPSAPIQFLAPGDHGLKRALKGIKPGMHQWTVRLDNRDSQRVVGPDGKRRELPLAGEGEWRGALVAPPCELKVLDEKVPFAYHPPPELRGYAKSPEKQMVGVNTSHAQRLELREGLQCYLNPSADAHWFWDYQRYSESLYWGPFTGEELDRHGLLIPIERTLREKIFTERPRYEIEGPVKVLIAGPRPLAALGLRLAALYGAPVPGDRPRPNFLARTIRDRRVDLHQLDLGEEAEAVLEQLSAHLPPLPPDVDFRRISNQLEPPGLEAAWGPACAGLSLAALTPESLEDGKQTLVRLFIKNVSEADIHLALSRRPGYDYAEASSPDGEVLKSYPPMVFPNGFSGSIRAEAFPNMSVSFPPVAELELLRLEAGAVYELTTQTALRFKIPDGKPVSYGSFPGPKGDEIAETVIEGPPGAARVIWHLRSANGARYDRTLRKQVWPAKGGWSGVLRTAPQRVVFSIQ